jgi:tetratricopeptide (TPR) repeat protein
MLRGVVRRAFALWVAVALAPIVIVPCASAGADTPKHPTPEAVRAAQGHMAKARELYKVGDYPDAIAELETARALDPYAKDLVFNLGIVHEKALHIDDALHFYRLYLDMDLDAEERSRAEAIVKRLEGARAHVQPTATATVAPPPTETAPPPPPPGHGRMDGWTVTTGVLALGGFGVGIGFGALALATKPADGTMTSPTFTFQQLQQQTDLAHTYAIVSDIAFASGIVLSAVTLGLFFGRTKAPPRVVLVPQAGGLGVVGRF